MIRRCVVRTVNTEFKSRVKRSPIQAGFHLRRSQCRSRNQKRRTLRSSENSVLIPLTTPSLRLSENLVVGDASRNGRTKPITKRGKVHRDWFILPLLFPTPTIWFSLDHKRNVSDGVVSGVGRKWKRSDSSDSDSVALMTPA